MRVNGTRIGKSGGSNSNDCLHRRRDENPHGWTRDYLRAHKLAPTQCAPNMFRILGSVDALNEKMGLGLTHHDVNWVYNFHRLKGQGYYLKSRYPKVRLIQCLLKSNKGLNKDFLILSREWSDGLPCPFSSSVYNFFVSFLDNSGFLKTIIL